MTLSGKGMMIWRIERCEGGNADAIADVAQKAGFTYILIKIANGILPYNIDENGNDMVPALVSALRSKGIQVWGWHYVYGNNPQSEAKIAVRRVQQFSLDGYVIDAEQEYKQAGKENAAISYMGDLRSGLPHTPIGLCSYRFPRYHPELPWKVFLERCDINMPQVYWEKSHNPGSQLKECINQFKAISPFRPIIPVGPVYMGLGNWSASPEEITEFLETARKLNLPSAYFYEWYYGRTLLSALWDAIVAFPWKPDLIPPSQPPTVPQQITDTKELPESYIDALNTHDENQIIKLYTEDIVHISPMGTIQGINAVGSFLNSLLNQMLPSSTFLLTGSNKVGNSYNFTWESSSSSAIIKNGNDTIGVINNKIAYHYSYFTIM
jgi:hypothetical protein